MVKCGIEIHQRLATEHKLFCGCSALESGRKSGEIKRKLHPVPSELGKIDIAAQFEQLKGKTFVYDVYDKATCLVEADEEPPHEINAEAVEIALMVCKMMGTNVVDEIQVMRKTVIDGSNTSGFQRTAVIGLDGKIKTPVGGMGIQTVCLEEESAGIIGEAERAEMGQFRLDRLGIPLIEIATTADIKNGKEARTVAEEIGLMLRSTGRVQRGIGTIRQDINISVDGGARVEIKGVQELDLVEPIVDNEIARQSGLIALCEKIKRLKKGKLEVTDVTKLMEKTECGFVRESVWRGQKVFVAKFEGMAGIFGHDLYPKYRYGTELSGYAKAVGSGGIIHSDEDMKRYGFMEEIGEMERKIGKKEKDAWVMVVGSEKLCKNVLQVVYDRAYLSSVPEETRHALLNGNSEYMRPLPGAARMYPETDIRSFRITKDMAESASKGISDFGKMKKGLESRLNNELAEKMLRSEKLGLFNTIIKTGTDPTLVAVTIEDTLKTLRREGTKIEQIPDERISELFEEYEKGLFVKAAIPDILKVAATKPEKRVSEIVREAQLTRIGGAELKAMLKKMGAKNVSEVMQKYRLRVDPAEVKKLL